MSKALVIKGANFLANRIEQISISDPIPCTGISLSQSTLAFTAIGATATITATLTPADTTEALTWVSSDTDVVTVVNGVVTCVGVGTATITATCGAFSASCAVTASITINLANTYSKDIDHRYTGSIDLPNNKDWIGLVTGKSGWTFSSPTNVLGGYLAFTGDGTEGKYLMPIPHNTSTITARYPSVFNYSALPAANSHQRSKIGSSAADCVAAVAVQRASTVIGNEREMVLDISECPTADGFVLCCRASDNSYDASTVTGDVTVTFS